MNLQKLLKLNNYFWALFFTAALLSGCGKEEPETNFVARVNGSYLTDKELSAFVDSGSVSNFYRNEIIRNWINKELLYQEAVRQGVLKDEEFNRLINDSKKEIAAALLLKKIYNKDEVVYEPRDLDNYFEKHKNDFVIPYNAYLLNIVDFSDENKAIQFRTTVLESDWNRALNVFKNDSTLIHSKEDILLYEQDIYPASLLRIVSELYPSELSIIINDEPGVYTVVQQIQKFNRGTIPPFEVIKNKVVKRFLENKKEEIVKNFIRQLYSDNDIEIKN